MKWENVKLGDIFTITSGGTPLRDRIEYYKNGNIPWVKTGDLKQKILRETEEFITVEALQNTSAKLFPKNTVLVAMYGATIGACSIIPFEASSNQACAALLPSKQCNEVFIYYYFKSIQEELVRMGVGGAQPNISTGKIKQLQIPLPPLPTQKKIAAILDAADEYRQKTKTLIEKYDQLAQSLFLEMFGDPVRNEKGWEKKTMKDSCTKITDGEHGTVERLSEGKLYLMARNITNNGLNFDEVSYISLKDHLKIYKRCNPEKNDLLLVCVGATIGKCCLVPEIDDFSLARSVALIKPNKKILNGTFLLYQFQNKSFQNQILNKRNTSAQAGLYTGQIQKLVVLCPDINIQKEFSSKIQLIEQQKQQAQSSLQKAEELFSSLLQRAFSGELVKE